MAFSEITFAWAPLFLEVYLFCMALKQTEYNVYLFEFFGKCHSCGVVILIGVGGCG